MVEANDAAAGVVARLSAEAELVDVGGFTLDPAAARTKLREHQLASEGGWALLLVEAGELAGVDRIEVSEGLSSVRVRLLGEAAVRLAPLDQLDMLFAWAFATHHVGSASASDADLLEARRLLALAVNAALARSVELTVIGPERGVRLRFDQSHSQRRDLAGGRPALLVKIGYSTRRSLADPAEASIEVVRRAGYGTVPVFVAGRRIDGEVPRIDGCRSSRPLVLDGREIGHVGLQIDDHQLPRIVLAPHGVHYRSIHFGTRRSAFFAVVTRGLERDLSFAKVVENEGYRRAIDAVMAAQPEFAALEAMPALMINESVTTNAWSPGQRVFFLRALTVVLGAIAALGLVLAVSGAGVPTYGTVITTVVSAALSVLSGVASIHARRVQVLFARPSLTAKQEQLFFGSSGLD